MSAEKGDFPGCVNYLKSSNSILSVNAVDSEGQTPSMKAAKNGRLKILELLISSGANLEVVDPHGWNVLHFVAQHNQAPLVSVILDRSPILLNKKDKLGLTPLHVAAWTGNLAVVKRLLDEGADLMAESAWGETPLHHAAYFGHTEICELLLNSTNSEQERKKMANFEDKMKRTPFSLAMAREDPKLAKLFEKYSNNS
jgi:ankyrin repeat protein